MLIDLLPCVQVTYWPTAVGFYLMQREHSKSLGSSRSLGTLLQGLSLACCFLELFAIPEVNQREQTCSKHLTSDQWYGEKTTKYGATVLLPCFLCLPFPLSMKQGSISDTDSFLFSRLPFSWSPSWGAEQTLFSPSSAQMEPCSRSEWARLSPWRSRLSQCFWKINETIGASLYI